ILRRADKNDDEKLSCDELKAYFADGILSGEELQDLFCTIIDTILNNSLDTEELCGYFSKYLGEYENVLCVLEDLNITILKAMDKTKKVNKNCDIFFTLKLSIVTRFLLRETLNQLQSLQSSLECAMETTEEQTQQERRENPLQLQGRGSNKTKKTKKKTKTKKEVLSVQWPGKNLARRLQRNNSLSSNYPYSRIAVVWTLTISIFFSIASKDLKLEPLEEVLEENAISHILIVQHQMFVIEEKVEEFHLTLKPYVESASAQGGCLHVSIQKLPNNFHFIVYEFWENSNAWKNFEKLLHFYFLQLFSHLQRNYSKEFQRSNVDFLETPELITTMLVPGKY
ncbi:NECA1 protein, partial [Leucopsar rothschildi]|nr:NECA1 protein [Leucopsar rothschildi]